MAEQPCLPQVQACVIRVAILDTSGVPLPGAENLYTSDALTTLTFTPVYTDGDEIDEKNGCGTTKVNYRATDTFKRGDVAIGLVTPDPFLVSMLSAGDVLQDGARRGFAAPPLGAVTTPGISVELWAKRIDEGDLDADSPYAWWAYPKLNNLRLGPHTHQNGALLPTFTGQAYENPNWYDGPLNDWPATSDRVYQWIPTDTLPDAACGFQALLAS
jgi:hypothetical protein